MANKTPPGAGAVDIDIDIDHGGGVVCIGNWRKGKFGV